MGSPFSSMDPYLENPETWPNLHSRLIVGLANLLGPQVRPKYRVVVEEAVYKRDDRDQAILIGVPDVSIRQRRNSAVEPEQLTTAGKVALADPAPVAVTLPMPTTVRHRYLEIRSLQTSDVITVIEILSPINKQGKGRQKYENKRLEILESDSNLVEIDLLHKGQPMPMLDYDATSHYRILVSDSTARPNAQLYPFNLQQGFPNFAIPLKAEDGAIALNLSPLLDEIYNLSGYDLDIDYCQDPQPNWPAPELTWLDKRLRTQGLR